MSRGTYFRKCPICGCALDPGERCDCQDREEAVKAAAEKESVRERLAAVAVASGAERR